MNKNKVLAIFFLLLAILGAAVPFLSGAFHRFNELEEEANNPGIQKYFIEHKEDVFSVIRNTAPEGFFGLMFLIGAFGSIVLFISTRLAKKETLKIKKQWLKK